MDYLNLHSYSNTSHSTVERLENTPGNSPFKWDKGHQVTDYCSPDKKALGYPALEALHSGKRFMREIDYTTSVRAHHKMPTLVC